MQMHSNGASVADIRRAIDQKYQVGVSDQHADASSALEAVYMNAMPLRSRSQRERPESLHENTSRCRVEPAAEAFARLFESVHEGVYIGTVNGASSQTLAANPHLKLMFGFGVETSEHDVRPFEVEHFVDPQARDGFLGRLQRDGAVRDYLLRLRRADRTPMWVEVTAHAERGRDGLRVEALMRDVSDRKRLEDQARDLYHQLLQAEKLAALGQTISGVAHELNNPLATILTWAERLSQRPSDDHTRRGLEAILERVGTRRQDRPQPADLRAQAPYHAGDGRSQSGRQRNAGAALLRAARQQRRRPSRRSPPACRRRLPTRIRFSRSCST